MIRDYLKAGYPALLVLTQEPHRAESVLVTEGWQFFAKCFVNLRAPSCVSVWNRFLDFFTSASIFRGTFCPGSSMVGCHGRSKTLDTENCKSP